jgi:heme exporter protein A
VTHTSQPDVAVRLRGISRRFGWHWALRDVDLEVPHGGTVLLAGPNGAGKTTLLRILAGVLTPTRGDGTLAGAPLSDSDLVRRRSTLLTIGGHLYDELTALENLRFASLMGGGDLSAETHAEILVRVGLAGVADRHVGAFSSGMRKRLALGQLLLRPVEVVLMDEPYASLDDQGRGLVDDVVSQMKAAGQTVLIASHQIGESRRLIDRVAFIDRGLLAFTCATDDFLERRRTYFGGAQ